MARKINYANQIVAGRVADLIAEIEMKTKEICEIEDCERKKAYFIKNGTTTPSFKLISEVSARSGKSLEWIINGEE